METCIGSLDEFERYVKTGDTDALSNLVLITRASRDESNFLICNEDYLPAEDVEKIKYILRRIRKGTLAVDGTENTFITYCNYLKKYQFALVTDYEKFFVRLNWLYENAKQFPFLERFKPDKVDVEKLEVHRLVDRLVESGNATGLRLVELIESLKPEENMAVNVWYYQYKYINFVMALRRHNLQDRFIEAFKQKHNKTPPFFDLIDRDYFTYNNIPVSEEFLKNKSLGDHINMLVESIQYASLETFKSILPSVLTHLDEINNDIELKKNFLRAFRLAASHTRHKFFKLLYHQNIGGKYSKRRVPRVIRLFASRDVRDVWKQYVYGREGSMKYDYSSLYANVTNIIGKFLKNRAIIEEESSDEEPEEKNDMCVPLSSTASTNCSEYCLRNNNFETSDDFEDGLLHNGDEQESEIDDSDLDRISLDRALTTDEGIRASMTPYC